MRPSRKPVDVSAAASHSAANAIRVADGCRASHRPVHASGLLFEILALRHQLGVLSRSQRRFRTSDRLVWLCLRRVWPRWREALVLVQPATVDRWHREGFCGWWRRPSRRRPGRPRIDLPRRSLIERRATANGLWGAPRIHGELLKLGFTVSERTVSRYLPDRRTRRSQTWRTFFANHVGNLAFTATATSSFATSDEDVEPRSCCALLFGRHAPGGSCLLSGWWSMGLLRSNRRCLAGKSRRITFAAAHPHGSDLARARRGRVPSNPLPALPSDSVIIGHFWRRRELAHETQNVREHSSDVVFGSDTF